MPKFHTSLVYSEYASYFKKIQFKTEFNTKLISQLHIINRLKQKYVSTTLPLYTLKFNNHVKTHNQVPSDDLFFDLKSVKVDSKNNLKISALLIFKFSVEFFFEWSLFLFYILQNKMASKKHKLKNVSLFFGLGLESILSENSDKRFVNYLERYDDHKIEPLSRFSHLIVQSAATIKSVSKNIEYTKYPQAYILKKIDMTWRQYFKVIFLHALSLIDFFKILFFHHELSFVIRDFASLRVLHFVAKNNMISDVMYTISNYAAQPLWMRLSDQLNFKVHMIHYAQNTRQIVYKDYKVESVNPCFYHIYADTVWVWTDDYKMFAEKVYMSKDIRAVGPIMFYFPTEYPKKQIINKNEFTVSLFDVTPIHDAYANQIGLLDNYYSGKNLVNFLTHVVDVCSRLEKDLQIKVKIFLKHKRSFNRNHDMTYINLCQQLNLEGKLTLVDYNKNVFDLISDTDTCIAIPYTSTAHICAYYNRQSFYYDPTDEVLLQPNFNDRVVLIGNQNELYIALKKKIFGKTQINLN